MVQSDETQQHVFAQPSPTKPSPGQIRSRNSSNNNVIETKKKHVKKTARKRYKKIVKTMTDDSYNEVIAGEGIEDDAQEVRARFQLGCECQDDRCFKGLNPENVYK